MTLPKAEWGAKHICKSCGAKFYDMLQCPPTCPSCGAVIEIETKRKTRPVAEEKKAERKKAKNDEIADEDEVEEIDDDPDEDLLPDDEEEDDDGIGDVGRGKPSDEDEQET